jgi:vacuolar-type H+-ATPase subunit H
MNGQSATIKAFEEKLSAQLQEAKSQIDGIEARAKGKMAQAEIDAISGLKTQRQEIEKKRQDLKTSGEAKAAQLKSEIEADMAKFKTSLDQLGTKVKSQAATK